MQCLTHLVLVVGQDMLSEALLCFGASSTSIDEEDNYDGKDEVHSLLIYYVSFGMLFYFFIF